MCRKCTALNYRNKETSDKKLVFLIFQFMLRIFKEFSSIFEHLTFIWYLPSFCNKPFNPSTIRHILPKILTNLEYKIQKFKMPELIWWTKMQKVTSFGWNSVLRSFCGPSRIATQNLEIQHCGSNVVDRNAKSDLLWIKLGTPEFPTSLVKNVDSTFDNFKYRTQYGGLKCGKWLRIGEARTLEFPWLQMWTQTQKFKMKDPIWRTEKDRVTSFRVFKVANYKFELKIQEFKIADENAKGDKI